MNHIEILIQSIRKRKGISIRELSRKSGVSHTQILRIETGMESPSLRTLLKLADALGVDIKDTFIVIRGRPGHE